MTVYLDQVWLLNTLLDYLLLVSTAQIGGRWIRRIRFLLVAALGGGYAAAGFVWPLLHVPLLRVLWGIALGWLAFHGECKWWRSAAMFFLLSAALAGAVTSLGLTAERFSWYLLLLSSGVFTLVLELVFRQAVRFGRDDIKPVHISVEDRECTLRALRDTGNTLRSPTTGMPVLVAESSALSALWGGEERSVLRSDAPPQEKVARMYALGNTRFSLLPYTAVGGSGLLLCMRTDAIRVGRRKYLGAPVALTERSLGANYEALWGGEEDGHELAAPHTIMDTAQVG